MCDMQNAPYACSSCPCNTDPRAALQNVPYACSSCPCTCEGPTCGDISRALPWAAVPSQYPATTSELTAPVTTPIPAQEPSGEAAPRCI